MFQLRKAATEAVRIVLKASLFMKSKDDDKAMTSEQKQHQHHPAAAITAKFCVKQIESSGSELNTCASTKLKSPP